MIPAGYMAKRVANRPDWAFSTSVSDVHSVSHCISKAFCDYIPHWKHNGFWFFDSPRVIEEVASLASADLASTQVFYYEVHEHEFDAQRKCWQSFSPEPSFGLNVVEPKDRQLMGYDVVTFSAHTSPECSPLSCNGLAERMPVNAHCLLSSLAEAKTLLESGAFDGSEPGLLRIFAVYRVTEL